MRLLPKVLEDVIEAFGKVPGVGPRTAERYAYFLLKSDGSKATALAKALENLHSGVRRCPVTFALIDSDKDVSPLYADSSRDKTVVALVAEPFDIIAMEKTRAFKGTYHVLGGLISPIDGIGPEQLHIPELKERITHDKVQEIILATNASVEGETTAMYIQQELKDQDNLSITRLAQGLPIGVDLEYADQITLGRALERRQKL